MGRAQSNQLQFHFDVCFAEKPRDIRKRQQSLPAGNP
jgi:hypothetical protein